jgi:hypothetical protein
MTKCSQCPAEIAYWDEHAECARCRPCSRPAPCSVCVAWTDFKWRYVTREREGGGDVNVNTRTWTVVSGYDDLSSVAGAQSPMGAQRREENLAVTMTAVGTSSVTVDFQSTILKGGDGGVGGAAGPSGGGGRPMLRIRTTAEINSLDQVGSDSLHALQGAHDPLSTITEVRRNL